MAPKTVSQDWLKIRGARVNNLQNIDLVAMFALASGAKFRVSLPGKRLEETLVKLQMQAA